MALQSVAEHLESLYEDYDNLDESYGESYSQYIGEIAQFGDAWAGSAIDLQEMRDSLAMLSDRIDAVKRIQANLTD